MIFSSVILPRALHCHGFPQVLASGTGARRVRRITLWHFGTNAKRFIVLTSSILNQQGSTRVTRSCSDVFAAKATSQTQNIHRAQASALRPQKQQLRPMHETNGSLYALHQPSESRSRWLGKVSHTDTARASQPQQVAQHLSARLRNHPLQSLGRQYRLRKLQRHIRSRASRDYRRSYRYAAHLCPS